MKDYRKIMRAKREAKGLSQHKLGPAAWDYANILSEIERGRKNPSLEQFFRICEALDIQMFPEEE